MLPQGCHRPRRPPRVDQSCRVSGAPADLNSGWGDGQESTGVKGGMHPFLVAFVLSSV